MKLEIDLNDILGNEYGTETLQDSIRRQIVEGFTATIRKSVNTEIEQAVSKTITTEIKTFIEAELPGLMATLLEAEYTPVGRYGEQSKPTTFRAELVKSITENMVYKRASHESDKNAFTKAVDAVISESVNAFKQDFQKQVDANYTAEVMQFAQESLKKKLGIK
jgi:hypothetical protein